MTAQEWSYCLFLALSLGVAGQSISVAVGIRKQFDKAVRQNAIFAFNGPKLGNGA